MTTTIIGGTGLLGRSTAETLRSGGEEVIVAGRSAEGSGTVRCDIETGAGLAEAVGDSGVVIHLASNPARSSKVDIDGTKRLLRLVGDRHLIYMSIVGVDRHPFPYYKAKHEVERLIIDSQASHSILRATQFHDFLAFLIGKMTKPPVALVPRDFVFQPVSTGEVATRLAEIAGGAPGGRLPDLAGPEVLAVEDLARTFMQSTGKARPLLRVPVPGKSARAFREGVHTNPDQSVGRMTWVEWLSR